MKKVKWGAREYTPQVRPDGRLTARGAFAHAMPPHKGHVMCTVYVRVPAAYQGNSVGTRYLEVPALRHYLPRETPPEAQLAYMEVMLDAGALQQECDLYVTEKGNPK